MSKLATIYALLYGDNYNLHNRLVSSFIKHLPDDDFPIYMWCNTVCKRTLDLLDRCKQKWSGFAYEISDENVPKYKAMRKMFHERFQPTTPWVIWFDDDSYIEKADWWKRTTEKIQSDSKICYMGQPWFVHHLPGQWEFIKESEWFKGKPSEMCPTRNPKVKKPGITFAGGAYWWLRTDVMKQVDWPDVRLNHNGGDTLLGEAVRQQGLPFTKFYYGVAVNRARRRGYHEKPAGSDVDTRR